MRELSLQGINDFELWEGIYLPSIKASINAAHKQIVEYAQVAGWHEVAIAEDDVWFTNANSWQYFLDHKPKDFDLYLSMIYIGDIDENNEVKKFTGLTLYIVAERFFQTFLSTDPNDHLDHALANKGKYVVCNPFIAKQFNGFSANTGKEEIYDTLTANRAFL